MKIGSKTKRDMTLILIVIGLLGTYLFVTSFLIVPRESTAAKIFYGNNQNPIVTIDFINEQIIVHFQQENSEEYPFIDIENNRITLLGDFEINGVRQEVVIGYDFLNLTVEILEEESPYHICSNQGASSGQALICLPNAIRVEFTSAELDFIL
jgi:hypothetical protein